MFNSIHIKLWFTEEGSASTELHAVLNGGAVSANSATLSLTSDTLYGCHRMDLNLQILNPAGQESRSLRADSPIRVELSAQAPQAITSFYLYNPWWTRPAFGSDFSEIPEKTQLALFQYSDRIVCFLPMVGTRFKAMLRPGTSSSLCLELSAGVEGITSLQEPLCFWAEADTAAQAVEQVFRAVCRVKGLRPRQEKALPELFRYLGWCSWDAFYAQVDEEKLLAKAEELKEKQVPVRWMLIDDGWMQVNGRQLSAFGPDPVKFPRGFAPLVQQLHQSTSIRWVGVWHALMGYWDGVDPAGSLAKSQVLAQAEDGLLALNPKEAGSFYRDWYTELKAAGIDFAKADGQSAASIFFHHRMPLAEAAAGLGQALEAAAGIFDGAVINCMGMAMETVLARSSSALSRNSDDFVPQKPESFSEHLLQNAYNALYHNKLYICDWDMFWTNHPAGAKHALLRAVSGGPVYVSDRLGETVPEVLKPLCDPEGRIYRMDRSAQPTEDCVFRDPRKDGVLKLQNTVSGKACRAGGLAVFNLTGKAQPFTIGPGQLAELPRAEAWLVYDWFRKKASVVQADGLQTGILEPEAYGWYLLFPINGDFVPLGLTEKYVSPGALESLRVQTREARFRLRQTGTSAWWCRHTPRQVRLNGQDLTACLRFTGGLWELPLPEAAEPADLTVYW